MAECRYYEMCARRAGSRNLPLVCDARHCWTFRPMPDVSALAGLADEMQGHADAEDYGGDGRINAGCLWSYADRIREALGVTDG